MNRRGFLGAIIAAASAPAIVRAESLMPTRSGILVPERVSIWKPKSYVAEPKFTLFPGSGLKLGDLITIAGVAGTFEVKEVNSVSGLIDLAPAVLPAISLSNNRFDSDS